MSKTLEMKASHGKFIVELFNDENYPSICVDYIADGTDTRMPICTVEDAADEVAKGDTAFNAVAVRIWKDQADEVYTARADIPIKEIRDAANAENCE